MQQKFPMSRPTFDQPRSYLSADCSTTATAVKVGNSVEKETPGRFGLLDKRFTGQAEEETFSAALPVQVATGIEVRAAKQLG